MSNRMSKVVSKLYRIQLTDDLREMIQKLPVRGLKETQEGDYVYAGSGEVEVGSFHYPVWIRVRSEDGGLTAVIEAPKAYLELQAPFGTKEERRDFPKAVRKAVSDCLN